MYNKLIRIQTLKRKSVETLVKSAELNHAHNSDVLRSTMSLLAYFPKAKVGLPAAGAHTTSAESGGSGVGTASFNSAVTASLSFSSASAVVTAAAAP